MRHNTERMFPVRLMLNESLRRKMAAVSERTSFSMSLLARISVARLMRELGDAEDPDLNVLMRYFRESGEAGPRSNASALHP